jgi:hypothetical protein
MGFFMDFFGRRKILPGEYNTHVWELNSMQMEYVFLKDVVFKRRGN